MSCFLLFGRGRVFFCCLGGGPGPAQTAKKHTPPPKQQNKKTRPRPFRACCFFAVWAGGCVYFFCCLGRGRVFFVFAVWSGCVFIFCRLGGGVFFFCCLGGGVFFVLLFGPGACFFLLFGRRTGVHSLTRLPGSPLSDPTTKETEQQKKNTGSNPRPKPSINPNLPLTSSKPPKPETSNRVAVKELNSSYCLGETLSFSIYMYTPYGDLA